MYCKKIFNLILLFVCVIPAMALAQKPFVEGMIVYNISIGAAAGGVDMAKHAGTFTITVKGKMIRKDLKLDNGYQNTILYNGTTKTGYSLRTLPDNRKYAVQLSETDIAAAEAPYKGFTLGEEQGTLTLAGYTAVKAMVNYKDGRSDEIYYSKEWAPAQPFIFDRYPDIKYYPLSFRYKSDEGLVMIFEAGSISELPVENSIFRLPNNYKIITNEAYKALNK